MGVLDEHWAAVAELKKVMALRSTRSTCYIHHEGGKPMTIEAPPKPRESVVRISNQLREEAKVAAARERMSLREWLDSAIQYRLIK